MRRTSGREDSGVMGSERELHPPGRAVRRPDSRADRKEGSGLWVCAHTNTHTYVVLEVLLLPEF